MLRCARQRMSTLLDACPGAHATPHSGTFGLPSRSPMWGRMESSGGLPTRLPRASPRSLRRKRNRRSGGPRLPPGVLGSNAKPQSQAPAPRSPTIREATRARHRSERRRCSSGIPQCRRKPGRALLSAAKAPPGCSRSLSPEKAEGPRSDAEAPDRSEANRPDGCPSKGKC